MMLRTAARSLPWQTAQKHIGLSLAPSICLRNTARAMSSHLPTVKPPLSTALPTDSYQLLSTSEKGGAAEDTLFAQEVEDVKQWWVSPRYEGIRRPYSAEDVVSKRGTLQQTYPSSLMATKLFNLLKEKAAIGEPVHTSERSQE